MTVPVSCIRTFGNLSCLVSNYVEAKGWFHAVSAVQFRQKKGHKQVCNKDTTKYLDKYQTSALTARTISS